MFPSNIPPTNSDGELKNDTIFLRNTQDIMRKQLDLARDKESVLQPFVQGSAPEHPLYSKFCKNVFARLKNQVQRCTSLNIFRNKNTGKRNLSFEKTVHVYSDKTATALKTNAIVAYPVHVVLLKFA